MPKLIIDLSGIGGLAPQYGGNIERSSLGSANPELKILGKDNQYANGIVNPLKKLGYMSPANNTIENMTESGDYIMRSTIGDDVNNKIYMLEAGPKIFRTVALPTLSITSVNTIAGTNPIGTDLEIYTINGVRKLFYAYNKTNSVEGDIGINDFSTTWDDDWLSTACAGGFHTSGSTNLRMIVADNGFMYILDGAAVHKIDGTTNGGANGRATGNILLFPATFQLVDGIDLNGKLWMTLIRSSINALTGTSTMPALAGVYVWDRQSTIANMTDFIPIEGIINIRNIFSIDNIPYCFTVNTHNVGEIRKFNGRNFEVVQELGVFGYPTYLDSLQNIAGGVIWLAVGNCGQAPDGIIYFYGRPYSGADIALYKVGDISASVSTGKTYNLSGAIALSTNSITGTTGYSTYPEAVYLSYSDSTITQFIKRWFINATGTTDSQILYPHAGNVYSLVKALPKLSKVTGVTLYYPPLSATSSTQVLDVDLYFNQATTSWGTTTLTRTDGVRGYHYIPAGKENVNFIQLGLKWKTANAMAYAITPSYAEVEYELTTKLK